MELNVRRFVVPAAVATGALLLIALVTFAVLVGGADRLVAFLGLGPLEGWPGVAVVAGAALVALEAAFEVAVIRLHGYRALRRGGRVATIARHAILVVPLVVATGFVVGLLASMAQWGLGRGHPTILGLVLVVALGLAWTAIRAAGSYRRGRHRVP